ESVACLKNSHKEAQNAQSFCVFCAFLWPPSVPLPALPINKANEIGDHLNRQEVRDKHVKTVDQTGDNDVLAAECLHVCNAGCSLCRHPRLFTLFCNARARSEPGLGDTGTKHRNRHSCSCELVVNCR